MFSLLTQCKDAVVLEGLVNGYPNSPIIPMLVKGLLDVRTDGRWSNTQENAWVILALNSYFQGEI
jgi:hypothetical protein